MDTFPSSMVSFLRGTLRESLREWTGSDEEKDRAAEKLLSEICCAVLQAGTSENAIEGEVVMQAQKKSRPNGSSDGGRGGTAEQGTTSETAGQKGQKDDKNRRKELNEKTLGIAQALRARHGADVVADLLSAKEEVSVSDLFQGHLRHKRANVEIFNNITGRHKQLATLVETQGRPWQEAVLQDLTSMHSYAHAATAMGEKAWVKLGHAWMRDTAIECFRHGGAKRHYLKHKRAKHFARNGCAMSDAEYSELSALLAEDLLSPVSPNESEQKLRLLDIGSCYNPFQQESQFEVTALDLSPTHESVYCCDFLGLKVGTEKSAVVVAAAAAAAAAAAVGNSIASSVTTNDDVSSHNKQTLLSLPASSFEIATLSLVISYLPTPQHRRDMLLKARALLAPPDASGNEPHKAGLLLIVEKESVLHSGPFMEKFLRHWKAAASDLGYELFKYEMLISDRKKAHAFAFLRTSEAVPEAVSSAQPEASASEPADNTAKLTAAADRRKEGGLYIKADLDVLQQQTGLQLSEKEVEELLFH